jgi:hypothetical protein
MKGEPCAAFGPVVSEWVRFNSHYQDVVDRFVSGGDVPEVTLRQAWQNTTVANFVWERDIYERFFRAVRTVNASNPAQKRLRVLLGDPPIDWSAIQTPDDLLKDTFRSHLAMKGAGARAIKELAGHRDLSTTQRYMHVSPAAVESAIRLLDSQPMPVGRGDSEETHPLLAKSVGNLKGKIGCGGPQPTVFGVLLGCGLARDDPPVNRFMQVVYPVGLSMVYLTPRTRFPLVFAAHCSRSA